VLLAFDAGGSLFAFVLGCLVTMFLVGLYVRERLIKRRPAKVADYRRRIIVALGLLSLVAVRLWVVRQ
jgi:hypothetical protein